jgi:hypothetical protein
MRPENGEGVAMRAGDKRLDSGLLGVPSGLRWGSFARRFDHVWYALVPVNKSITLRKGIDSQWGRLAAS